MRTPRNTDKEKAITLICKSVVQADISVVKKMLCLAVGHPPLIKIEGGRIFCVRCGEPSVIPGADSKLTPTDRLLTGEFTVVGVNV